MSSGRVLVPAEAVKFLVERRPDWASVPGCKDAATLPITVLVNPEPVKSVTYMCPKCDVIYRVIPRSIRSDWRPAARIHADANYTFVCLCQGKFIE